MVKAKVQVTRLAIVHCMQYYLLEMDRFQEEKIPTHRCTSRTRQWQDHITIRIVAL